VTIRPRTAIAAALLCLEACLAGLAVVLHFGFTAEYGDVTETAFHDWMLGFTAGIGGIALVVVGIAAVATMVVASRLWVRLTAVAIPMLMVLGMLAVTPAALKNKLEVQYDATPRCVSEEDIGPGPGSRAARESQQAFESIDHVGHFGRGGGSGVGGCDRPFLLPGDVDEVMRHYRAALTAAGWRVVEDKTAYLRAERADMAFEVAVCSHGGVVWAGKVGDRGRARCDLTN
jgi:hypothetical protein